MGEWKIVEKSLFTRQYKNIGHMRQARVDLAIKDLLASDDPTDMGRYKNTVEAFAYEIGRSDRLIYRVDNERLEIILMCVGDHKAVYRKD